MLSKRKVADAIIAWLEQQLREVGSDRSIRDDTDGNAIHVSRVLQSGTLLFVHVSVTDESEAVQRHEFCLQLVSKVKDDVGMGPTAGDLAAFDETP